MCFIDGFVEAFWTSNLSDTGSRRCCEVCQLDPIHPEQSNTEISFSRGCIIASEDTPRHNDWWT